MISNLQLGMTVRCLHICALLFIVLTRSPGNGFLPKVWYSHIKVRQGMLLLAVDAYKEKVVF